MTATVATDLPHNRYALRPDSLAGSFVMLLGMLVVQRAVGFGRSVLFCRWLSPEELGRWDLTFAFLELAAPVAVLSLPALFGRYVEHYRRRDQLRTFLLRIHVAIALLAGVSVAALCAGRSWFAGLLYGGEGAAPAVLLLAAVLPALILHNSACLLFGGLRMYRVVSRLHFLQSLLFAALGVPLVLGWRANAESVLLAFGGACLLSIAAPLWWLGRMWQHLPAPAKPAPPREFWGKLLPFAGAVWVSNWLGNLFTSVDRYMLLHYSGMAPADALTAVGQYHSARVVPVLLIAVANIVAGVAVSFLSRDWEAGDRAAVSARLNSLVKLTGLGLTATSLAVLIAAPLLFGWAFAGKFDGGLSILPLTLMYCSWFGMFCVAKSWFWCDENVWLVSVAFAFGLTADVGLSLALMPRLGLTGAALAACGGNIVLLLAVYGLAARRGMHVSAGIWVVSAAPALLALPLWAASALLAALALGAAATNLVFDQEERGELSRALGESLGRLRGRWQCRFE